MIDVAIITGIYPITYSIGSALGNTVSGAMWQELIPNELALGVGDPSLATAVYADPFSFVASYPVGTVERTAVIEAYRHVQKLLCIAGICLAVLLVAFSLVIRDPKLGNEQSLEHAEENMEVAREDSRQ
jgi:SIT family siderophore-iron:H+ symporter-like MFS transporter